MIVSAIISKGLDLAINKLKATVKEHIERVSIDRKNIEESLDIHLKMVDNWSSGVNFKDLSNAKKLSNIYIHLDYYLTPKSHTFTKTVNSTKLEEIINTNENFVILGQPGAGKTTSMKFICQKIIFDEFFQKNYSFPLVIKFRELSCQMDKEYPSIIFTELFDILGLNIEYYRKGDKIEKKNSILKKAVISFIDVLKPVIILDGFDEIADSKVRDQVIKEIELLSIHLKSAKMVLTSRTGEFHYSLSNWREFEICPLSKDQIKEFTYNWLGDRGKADSLYRQLQDSPFFDTTMRPLTLAHLSAIYEREGNIPEKPKTVYRKVVNLLLEEWSMQRGIERRSHFSNFEVDRKLEFLSYLAYELTTFDFHLYINNSTRSRHYRNVFSTNDLKKAYSNICGNFELEPKDAIKVVKELESHNGLFIQTGYERFQFPHKSIQEYLSAEFLVKSFALPANHILLTIPNELALAVAISSIPTDYFSAIILNQLKQEIKSPSFIEPFINRLIIEKPDFQASLSLGVSFIYIYHYCFYTEKVSFHDTEYKYPSLKKLLTAFFNSFKSIRNSMKQVKGFYDIVATKSSTGDEVLLKRNANKIVDPIYSLNYPSEIISRAIYFEVTH